MPKSRFLRLCFVPVMSVGMIFGSLAVASADDDYDGDDYGYDDRSSPFYSPDTYADPATTWVPWAQGGSQGNATSPSVDTTVQCSPCS